MAREEKGKEGSGFWWEGLRIDKCREGAKPKEEFYDVLLSL
jgi:hypothetical protein